MDEGFLPNIFGGVLVGVYAWGRYGTPSTNRVSTTQAQFYFTCVTYILCSVILYGLLTRLVSIPEFLKYITMGGDKPLPEGAAALSAPFLAALLLTTLLPNTPGLSKLDDELLAFFRRVGSIPAEVNRLANQLNQANYQVPGASRTQIEQFINNSDAIPEVLIPQLRFDPVEPDSNRAKLTKVIALYRQIDRLKAQERFARFFTNFPDQEKKLDENMPLFFAQATGFFAFSDLIPREQQKSSPELQEARQSFKRQCNKIYKDLCTVISQILLHASWSKFELKRYLENLGFSEIAPVRPIIPYRIATAAILIFIVAVGGILVANASTDLSPPTAQIFTLALVIAVNHAVAVVFALMPKRVCTFADRMRSGERTVIGYLLSALLTAAVAAVIGFTNVACWSGGITAGLQVYAGGLYLWTLSPAVTSFALAFLCDGNINADRDPRWQKWAEGAFLGALLALTDFVIAALIAGPTVSHPRFTLVSADAAVLGLVIGGLLGVLIPHTYRTRSRSLREEIA
jgi:hypothetical protein